MAALSATAPHLFPGRSWPNEPAAMPTHAFHHPSNRRSSEASQEFLEWSNNNSARVPGASMAAAGRVQRLGEVQGRHCHRHREGGPVSQGPLCSQTVGGQCLGRLSVRSHPLGLGPPTSGATNRCPAKTRSTAYYPLAIAMGTSQPWLCSYLLQRAQRLEPGSWGLWEKLELINGQPMQLGAVKANLQHGYIREFVCVILCN